MFIVPVPLFTIESDELLIVPPIKLNVDWSLLLILDFIVPSYMFNVDVLLLYTKVFIVPEYIFITPELLLLIDFHEVVVTSYKFICPEFEISSLNVSEVDVKFPAEFIVRACE